ncbi:MAG: hypothetical protein H0V22_03625 [Solirubrobacterales bacterium]|nr:hypothetical protein [Solirubrobacterales bacterium]
MLAAPLAACTDRTVTDPAALVAELAAVKTRGWAEEDGEHRDGQVAVAAPVRVGGETIAAVTARASASGYAYRAADELVAEAQAYARDLESRLDPSGGCNARGAP